MIINQNLDSDSYLLLANKAFNKKDYSHCIDYISLAVEKSNLSPILIFKAASLLSGMCCYKESNFLLHKIEAKGHVLPEMYMLFVFNYEKLSDVDACNYYSDMNFDQYFKTGRAMIKESGTKEDMDTLDDLEASLDEMRQMDYRKDSFLVYECKTQRTLSCNEMISSSKAHNQQASNEKFNSFLLCRLANSCLEKGEYENYLNHVVSAYKLTNEYQEPLAILIKNYDETCVHLPNLCETVVDMLSQAKFVCINELYVVIDTISLIKNEAKKLFFATIKQRFSEFYNVETSYGYGYSSDFAWLKSYIYNQLGDSKKEQKMVRMITKRFFYAYPPELYLDCYSTKAKSVLEPFNFFPKKITTRAKKLIRCKLSDFKPEDEEQKVELFYDCQLRLAIQHVLTHCAENAAVKVDDAFVLSYSLIENCLRHKKNNVVIDYIKNLLTCGLQKSLILHLLLLLMQYIKKPMTFRILVDEKMYEASLQPVDFYNSLRKKKSLIFDYCALTPLVFGHNVFNRVVNLFKSNEISKYLKSSSYDKCITLVLDEVIDCEPIKKVKIIRDIISFEWSEYI